MTFLDRIKETSTSTGTGAFILGGAVTGYKAFSNGTYKYCIVNASETEWEVGEGTVASGVLTRTTIEASSNGGAAVNFTAGTKQVFNTVSAAYVSSLVPYTGATASVNLGVYGLSSDYLQLNTTPTATGAVGRMLWNDTDGTMDIGLKGGNVTLQVGQEQVVRVVNKVGSTLTEAAYQAVYISGAQGQRPKVALAQANVDATSASTIGLVTETIADNQEGFITTSGIVRGINTTGSLQGETWADGDIVYLSPTTAGRITNVKPTAPNHTVVIGYVIYAHATQGKIFVKVDNGYEIGELHDVYAPSPATGNGLFWNATNSRYELNTIAGVLGYTPQAAITLTTTGTSGAATLVGNTLNIPQYAAGITGSGTAGQVTYWSGTSAVSGSSNLFWDNTNSFFGVGTNSYTSTIARMMIISEGLRNPLEQRSYSDTVGSGTVYKRSRGTIASPTIVLSNDYLGAFEMLGHNGSTFTGGGLFALQVDGTPSLTSMPTRFSWSTTPVGSNTYTEKMQLKNNGNLILQNGGTFTDGGQRLQVIGSMRVGTTAASAMYWDDTNNFLNIGNSAYNDTGSSKFILGTTSTIGNSRITIASAQNYQDVNFVKTNATANTQNNWGFGQRFDTYFGNTSGSFQIVGGYIDNTGGIGAGTYAYRVPIICNPNGDVLINGASANALTRYIGLGVNAPTALTDIGASTTSRSSLRIRSGTAPTSPNDGDIWFTGTDLKIQIGGSTKTFTII